jgi:DNA (cytosine-5)-methyltransferase 1
MKMKELQYKNGVVEELIVNEPQLNLKFSSQSQSMMNSRKKDNSSMLNVLSLFSGCGGMDLGFEGGFTVHNASINEKLKPDFIEEIINDKLVKLRKTRFKTVFANDILSDARNAWVNHFQKEGHNSEMFHTDSIVDLVKLHKSGTEVFPKNVDIVTGGFPCQDFSISGKRNGFESHKNHKGEFIANESVSEETRGKLYMWMREVIEITKPKIFIAENVKGLVNLANVKEIIQNDFSSIGKNGYIVLNPKVLHAADYGVPQSRERVIFIGIKKSALKKSVLEELEKQNISEKYNPYPSRTHSYTIKDSDLKNPVQLKEIFSLLEEPEFSNDLSQKNFSKAKFMGKHCQGQIEIKLNGIAPTIRAEHHGNIEFRRLAASNGGNYSEELSVGLEQRRLTPRECALIQTFPIDYEFVIENKNGRKGSYLISPSQSYKIIGNAVPPLLAYNLAKRLEEVWPLFFKK